MSAADITIRFERKAAKKLGLNNDLDDSLDILADWADSLYYSLTNEKPDIAVEAIDAIPAWAEFIRGIREKYNETR